MRIASKVSVGLIIVMLVAVGVVWLTNTSGKSTSASVETPAKILVSQTPLSTPLFVAKQLGLFKLHGLDLTLLPCNGGVECMSMMKQGNADYATISESVAMFNSFDDTDFSIISTFVTSDNDLKLLALSKHGFTSIRDLQGKSVGVIKSSASEFYLDSLLLASGMKPNDVKRVYLKPDKLIPMLKIGDVDAISSWEPWGYRAQATMDVVNLGFQGMYTLSFNLATINHSDQDTKERSVRILSALHQAINWMQQHPDKAKAIVSDKLNIDHKQLDWMWNDYVFRLSMTNVLLANLQLQARWAIEHQLVQGDQPDLRAILDHSALKASQADEETQP